MVTTASASLHWNLNFYFYDARVKKRREYVHHGVNDVKVLEVIVYIWRRWRGDKCLACACGHGRGRMGHVNVMGPLCVAQNPRWIAASTLVLPPPPAFHSAAVRPATYSYRYPADCLPVLALNVSILSHHHGNIRPERKELWIQDFRSK